MSFLRKLLWWIPLAIVITMLSLLVYAAVQQTYRSEANDPQIEITEEISRRLAAGQPPEAFIPQEKIDLATSLSTYVTVYDAQGQPVASSGQLDGQPPAVPAGVLESAKRHGQNRLTWQPRPELRNAIVVRHFTGQSEGYILAGRSLREVESRVRALGLLVAITWSLTMLLTFIAVLLLSLLSYFGGRAETIAARFKAAASSYKQ